MEILSTRMSFCVRLLEVGDEDSPPVGSPPVPTHDTLLFSKILGIHNQPTTTKRGSIYSGCWNRNIRKCKYRQNIL